MEIKGFYCYKTVYDTLIELAQKDEDMAYRYIRAVMDYAFTGDYDESDSIINALMQSAIFGIDNAEKRYEKNIEDGKRGGRPRKTNDEEIQKLLDEGKDKKEIAKIFNCSVRTVERTMARLRQN